MIVTKVLIKEADNSKTPVVFVHDEHFNTRIFIDNKGNIRRDINDYTYCDEPEVKFNL